MLKTVAKEKYHENGSTDFLASNGYLETLKKRLCIKNIKLHGDAASVDEVKVHEWKLSTLPIINEYSPVDIYNIDETGLFIKKLPEQTFILETDDPEIGQLRGVKQDKTRVSIVCACNMVGDKEKLTVIYKCAKPRAFQNINFDYSKLPVNYYYNSTADEKLQLNNRKILLLLDNFRGHYISYEPKNIRFLFLEPNSTSKTQPLDAGIIKSFKDHYLSRYSQILYESHRLKQIDVTEFVKKFDILKVIKIVHLAWQDVKPEIIGNCWKHVGLSNSSYNSSNCQSLVDHNY
ncbi:uncharacterized protein LOC128386195 [Panonychus citri]|uniref:uncharacterized protein LOC128386195 n=1 Tax=Panonychus citri TaxID=50023 RepID=UPI00230748F7|nr:uncharacterized protein LOC128386195 [Panonychus citri]